MAYTRNKSIVLLNRMKRMGLDWNGNHQVPFYAEVGKLTRTRTGDRNPKWRSQVKAGQNATTAMTGLFDSIESTPGTAVLHCQQPSGGGPYYDLTFSGDLAAIQAFRNGFNWTPMSASVAYNRGLTSYLKRVSQVNQAFSGLTFLGELRETVRMIRNPAQNLRNILGAYVDDLKKSKKRSPKNWKKNLSGAWLEHAFGMTPLISDIQNASRAYNRLVEEPTLIPVRGVGVHEASVPSRTFEELLGSILGTYTPMMWHSCISTDKAVVVFRGMVKRESRATAAGKAALFGFSPEQFIPTVWELLPWSFLIDYFTNIGDIIETGVVNQGSIAWTNVSQVVFQIRKHQMRVAPANFQQGSGVGKRVSGQSSTAIHTRRRVDRSTPSSIGIPKLTIELPGREAQWANMTALFSQVSTDLHDQRVRRHTLPPRLR